jgi:hypothetical protein
LKQESNWFVLLFWSIFVMKLNLTLNSCRIWEWNSFCIVFTSRQNK